MLCPWPGSSEAKSRCSTRLNRHPYAMDLSYIPMSEGFPTESMKKINSLQADVAVSGEHTSPARPACRVRRLRPNTLFLANV